MKISLSNYEAVTPEKAAFVEEKANDLLDFVMESRQQLTSEAHTTLNWLFAIVVGGSGYVITLANAENRTWWLLVPLLAVVAISLVQAAVLFHWGLRVVEVLPKGNTPRNLLTDELLQYDVEWMRLAEAAQLQERIEIAIHHNKKVGSAINAARWCITLTPAIAAAVAAVTFWLTS